MFTDLQLMALEKRFESQKYLSTPDRIDVAEALGLSQLQVKTWYQNRRMKWKKQVHFCLVDVVVFLNSDTIIYIRIDVKKQYSLY